MFFPLSPSCSVRSEISSTKVEFNFFILFFTVIGIHCFFGIVQVRVSLPTLEVFVLPLHGLQMVQRFFIRVLEFEELSPK